MTIMIQGGAILVVDGDIATDPDCCCNAEYEPCPPSSSSSSWSSASGSSSSESLSSSSGSSSSESLSSSSAGSISQSSSSSSISAQPCPDDCSTCNTLYSVLISSDDTAQCGPMGQLCDAEDGKTICLKKNAGTSCTWTGNTTCSGCGYAGLGATMGCVGNVWELQFLMDAWGTCLVTFRAPNTTGCPPTSGWVLYADNSYCDVNISVSSGMCT